MPKFLKKWLEGARSRSGQGKLSTQKMRRWGSTVARRLPRRLRHLDVRKLELKKVSEHSSDIRWILVILGVFLLSEIAARVLGLWIRPIYPTIPRQRGSQVARTKIPSEDYDAILRRNMFNVEGKIPDPFDQGLLDCMSQAKRTTQKMILHGTIVMQNENLSVALVQLESDPIKLAVKKDEPFFDNRFIAMKVERKRLCFQVRETQEFEYIEIPEEGSMLGVAPSLGGDGSTGIVPVSETEFAVKGDFLQKSLNNLNEILQTARAVPYVDTRTGKFQGFLVQSIDSVSPFAQLGIRQGDILTSVNDILLDNPGKGLEAFQRLRDSKKVTLDVIRGGQKMALTYDVK